MLPPDNPPRVLDIRAAGSEVECVFATTKPVLPFARLEPLRLRLRYCVCRRRTAGWVDLFGDGRWKAINPDRPIILDAAIPGIPLPAADLAKDHSTAIRAIFDRLPPDDRAADELIRQVFGPPGGDLRLPYPMRGIAADSGRLYVLTGDGTVYIRDAAGTWVYGGECPGPHVAAAGSRLFCVRERSIVSRPVVKGSGEWEPWCELPDGVTADRYHFLAGGDDRLFLSIAPGQLYSRSAMNRSEQWVPAGLRYWPHGFAVARGTLFGFDAERLYARPADLAPADWMAVGPAPTGANIIVAAGDRLLACGPPGAIFSRPIGAAEEVGWSAAGLLSRPVE
jgi:hypothetical protein